MADTPLVRGLREQIVEQLRSDIISGKLTAGEPLREEHLARRFGVSRAPIRDALLQLTGEGTTVALANRGVFVAGELSNPVIMAKLIVPLRRRVESFALREAFPRLRPDDFDRWEEILVEMKKACETGDLAALSEQDLAFHRRIIERAEIPDVTAIWSTLITRLRLYFRQTYRRYDNLIDLYVEHAAVLEVFRRGNFKDALAALRRNIN